MYEYAHFFIRSVILYVPPHVLMHVVYGNYLHSIIITLHFVQ